MENLYSNIFVCEIRSVFPEINVSKVQILILEGSISKRKGEETSDGKNCHI